MGVEFAAERRLLAEDELEKVRQSHYPALEDHDHDGLVELARFLRSRHGRARDLVRDLRRARRGKAGGSGTPSERGLAAKKQVFARALKRVNARLAQRAAAAKRARALAAMQAALDRKREAADHRPGAGRRAHGGMRPRPSRVPRPTILGARIGRVSQANRNAQAARDAR